MKGTATVASNKTLTLGKSDHTINALSMNSGSQVEAAFTEGAKSVTVNSLTVANGVSTTLGTKQGSAYHNGYFNIKQLKGVGSTLVLSNGSQTSLSTVFDLGSYQGDAAFSGTLTLQANNATAATSGAKRGLVVNIKNSGLLANTVLELKGTNTNVTERMGIGLNQDTSIGGIKDNANNAPSNTYIQAGSFSQGYDMNNHPTASSSEANVVTLTIATDTDYSTSASILDKVNLTKTGTGKQIFSGDMGAFNGDITVTGGTLSFTGTTNTMGSADKDIDVTVTGEGSVLELNNTSILDTATVENGGTLSIGSGASLTLGTAATITGKDSGTVSMANVKMNATGISSADTTGANKGTISNAVITQLAEDASFTIEDMTLLNTTITAATPTTQVKLQNVEATNLALAKGAFTTDATAQAQVGMGGDESGANYSVTSSVLSGITLDNTQATIAVDLGDLSSAGVAIDKGIYSFAITLDDFHLLDYETQAGVLFTADSWLGQLLLGQGAYSLVSGAVETPASVSEGGGVNVSYSAATDGDGSNVGTIIIINGLNVPEPASATLGLAALMMLCARRRRK